VESFTFHDITCVVMMKKLVFS